MEANTSKFTLGTPEEVRAWFYRAKARIAAREEEIRAMYKEEDTSAVSDGETISFTHSVRYDMTSNRLIANG